jgi:hypothetical protein
MNYSLKHHIKKKDNYRFGYADDGFHVGDFARFG